LVGNFFKFFIIRKFLNVKTLLNQRMCQKKTAPKNLMLS
jgi:hypothetical protein